MIFHCPPGRNEDILACGMSASPPVTRTVLPGKLERIIVDLDEPQLRLLNRLVVERLKMLHKVRDLRSLSQFQPMDRACFLREGRRIMGTITRLNRRTVSLVTDDGHHWNVSPAFLTKIVEGDSGNIFSSA